MEGIESKEKQFAIRREMETRFTNENWMIRVNNELKSSFLPLDRSCDESRLKNHLQLLDEAERYYQSIDDDFNVFRIKLKKGNLEAAEELAQKFVSKNEEQNFLAGYTSKTEDMDKVNILELKKAYVLSNLAKYKKDRNLRQQAQKRFIDYASNFSLRDDLPAYEASALSYYQACNLFPKDVNEEIATKCVEQFRKVANNRAQVGDRWWESIALREIGKISTNSQDREVALQRSEELIEEYKEMGDYKKAALWARDVNDLNPSPENTQRMEELWDENIKKMEGKGDTRAIGKSYWSLYKRVEKYDHQKAEDCRLKAIVWYKKLLDEEKSKQIPKTDRIRECYWVFSELIR